MPPLTILIIFGLLAFAPIIVAGTYYLLSMQLLWFFAGFDNIKDRSLWVDYLREQKYRDSASAIERFFGSRFDQAQESWARSWTYLPKFIAVTSAGVTLWVLFQLLSH